MTDEPLKLETFAALLGTIFRVAYSSEAELEVELAAAAPGAHPGRAGGREPFSLIFLGPPQSPYLPQGTYRFVHPQLGNLDIFIVPIGPQTDRMQYQAVFG